MSSWSSETLPFFRQAEWEEGSPGCWAIEQNCEEEALSCHCVWSSEFHWACKNSTHSHSHCSILFIKEVHTVIWVPQNFMAEYVTYFEMFLEFWTFTIRALNFTRDPPVQWNEAVLQLLLNTFHWKLRYMMHGKINGGGWWVFLSFFLSLFCNTNRSSF
jgi:hypothetical protein